MCSLKKSIGLTLVVGTLATTTPAVSAYNMTGMYPMYGGMGGMVPMYGMGMYLT